MPTDSGIFTKTCTKCKRELGIEMFCRDLKRRDGLKCWCRGCQSAHGLAYRTAHKEERALTCAAYRATHKQEIAEAKAAWYADNADDRRKYKAAYYSNPEHRENRSRTVAAYRAIHRDQVITTIARTRARRLGAPAIERFDRCEVFERDGGICYLCGKAVDPSNWHLDHLIPLARGGEHSRTNVAVTHPKCNRIKGQRTAPEFAAGMTVPSRRSSTEVA